MFESLGCCNVAMWRHKTCPEQIIITRVFIMLEKEKVIDRHHNPILWLLNNVPRNQTQLEAVTVKVIKFVFWVAILAPVILLPLFYLVLAIFR